MKRLLLPTLFLVACFPTAAGPQASQQTTYAAAMGDPSHPATTPAQWSELEGRAASLAREGAMKVAPAEHLVHQGFDVEKRFNVTGGHCYAAGIAWAFEGQAQASVSYQARSDGKPVNDSVGGANGRLSDHGGSLHFCADRDGEALLSVSAIAPSGAIANNELLEYAFALGDKTETSSEASARRAQDRAAGAQAKANIETNIAISKERERRNLEERCRKCREELRLCQVQTAYDRQHPRSGVTYSTSCESKFGICATGKYSGTAEEMAQCGPPPQ
jgi:hypothetical protein